MSDVVPSPAPRRRGPAPIPHSAEDLGTALRRPLRIIDLTLAAPERLAANVAEERALVRLAICLVAGATLFAIPYGLVLGVDAWWKVVSLFLGSTLICVPSLHVFSAYLGFRMSSVQTLVIALCVPAAAAAFTLGFAPIAGFLRATMTGDQARITWNSISTALLAVSLAAGVIQLWRCVMRTREEVGVLFVALVGIWHAVFLYVLLHMARLLELVA